MQDHIKTHIKAVFEDELLDYLHEEKLITESMHTLWTMLTEASGEFLNPAEFYVGQSERPVAYDVFRDMWNDPTKYPDTLLIHNALRPNKAGGKAGSNRKWVTRVRDHFFANNPKARTELKYGTPDERKTARLAIVSKEVSDNIGDYVDPGVRGARSATGNIEKINNEDLFAGVFYSDRSKIPRRRWAAWWKAWDMRRTSVKPNDLMDRWEKHFVLGYQLDTRQFYEVWYNTMDTSFSLHDANGNVVGRPENTIRETVRNLFNAIAQFSDDDAEFFKKRRNFNPAGISGEIERRREIAMRKKQQAEKREQSRLDKFVKEKEREARARAKDAEREMEAAAAALGGSSAAPSGRRIVDPKVGAYVPDPETRVRYSVSINESVGDFSVDALTSDRTNPLYVQDANRRAEIAMSQKDSAMTKEMLSAEIIGDLVQYDQTKFKTDRRMTTRILSWFKNAFQLGRGRKSEIKVPMNFNRPTNRLANAFYGIDVRADFVTGFALGPVEMEIWYVQEMDVFDKDGTRTIFSAVNQTASYYVYDVRSKRIIAKNLPYYRLALQAVMSKIGVPVRIKSR